MVRKILFATVAMAGLATASPADAQRVWQNGRWVVMPQRTAQPMRGNPHRWGSMINGRWEAGYRAPGGWNAYRRMNRGAVLPGYWMGANFRINDYLNYGLAAPPAGYGWVRYYDDAVLVDGGGRVWDTLDGISWDGGSYAYAEAQAGGYAPPIVPVAPEAYDMAPPPPPMYREPAPYPAAPRHPAPMPYPAPYAPAPAYAPPPPPPCGPVCPAPGGYAQGAYYGGTYYGGTAVAAPAVYSSGGYGATTVVITSPPITTTTIVEEVIQEETVSTSYVRAAPRRVVRKAPVRRYKPRCVCVQICR